MKAALLTFFCGVTFIFQSLAAEKMEPLPGFQISETFHEQVLTFTNDLGVRVQINAPAPKDFTASKNVRLIFFSLPNGNTIEQTVGKKMKEGDDWHFNIQHVGAQTRFLRKMLTNEIVVVTYLESPLKSWPAWRKKNGDKTIPDIVASVKKHFEKYKIITVLSGHSGGGSFIFGYLNCFEKIPDNVERIAFLDSNYAYETGLHRDKLLQWLKSDSHFLTVLAYHDDIALLDGKTFVSAAGGTWGRSHLMMKDFETELTFSETAASGVPELAVFSALKGRVQFLLKENPEKKIFHTVQVEKNGFIHCMVSGTANEGKGSTYFGERVYGDLIAELDSNAGGK